MAGYKGHKHGSVKAQVRQCLDVSGEKAALKLGGELGIKESRLQRWFRKWASAGPTGRAKRVYWKVDPETKGVLILRGDEMSQVLWDDGTEACITNEYLVEIPAA